MKLVCSHTLSEFRISSCHYFSYIDKVPGKKILSNHKGLKFDVPVPPFMTSKDKCNGFCLFRILSRLVTILKMACFSHKWGDTKSQQPRVVLINGCDMWKRSDLRWHLSSIEESGLSRNSYCWLKSLTSLHIILSKIVNSWLWRLTKFNAFAELNFGEFFALYGWWGYFKICSLKFAKNCINFRGRQSHEFLTKRQKYLLILVNKRNSALIRIPLELNYIVAWYKMAWKDFDFDLQSSSL